MADRYSRGQKVLTNVHIFATLLQEYPGFVGRLLDKVCAAGCLVPGLWFVYRRTAVPRLRFREVSIPRVQNPA